MRHTRSGPGSIGAGAMSIRRVVRCAPCELIAAAFRHAHTKMSRDCIPTMHTVFNTMNVDINSAAKFR